LLIFRFFIFDRSLSLLSLTLDFRRQKKRLQRERKARGPWWQVHAVRVLYESEK